MALMKLRNNKTWPKTGKRATNTHEHSKYVLDDVDRLLAAGALLEDEDEMAHFQGTIKPALLSVQSFITRSMNYGSSGVAPDHNDEALPSTPPTQPTWNSMKLSNGNAWPNTGSRATDIGAHARLVARDMARLLSAGAIIADKGEARFFRETYRDALASVLSLVGKIFNNEPRGGTLELAFHAARTPQALTSGEFDPGKIYQSIEEDDTGYGDPASKMLIEGIDERLVEAFPTNDQLYDHVDDQIYRQFGINIHRLTRGEGGLVALQAANGDQAQILRDHEAEWVGAFGADARILTFRVDIVGVPLAWIASTSDADLVEHLRDQNPATIRNSRISKVIRPDANLRSGPLNVRVELGLVFPVYQDAATLVRKGLVWHGEDFICRWVL